MDLIKQKKPPIKKSKGFTFIELMVVVVIVAVLAAMAVPSYRDFIEKSRVKDATEAIYGFISQAKSEAVLRDQDIYLDFISGSGWCIGYTTAANCVCTTANSCVANVGTTSVTNVINTAEYPDVTVTVTNSLVTGNPTFDSLKGTITAGSVHVSSGNWGLSTKISGLGRVRACIDTAQSYTGVTGYESCN